MVEHGVHASVRKGEAGQPEDRLVDESRYRGHTRRWRREEPKDALAIGDVEVALAVECEATGLGEAAGEGRHAAVRVELDDRAACAVTVDLGGGRTDVEGAETIGDDAHGAAENTGRDGVQGPGGAIGQDRQPVDDAPRGRARCGARW